MNATTTTTPAAPTADPYRPASLGDFAGYPVRVGDLAYVDSFAGLVPCRVDRFFMGDPSNPLAYVTVTAARPGYLVGEQISGRIDRNVIARASVHVRGGQYRITAGTYAAATTGRTRHGRRVAILPDSRVAILGECIGSIDRMADGLGILLYAHRYPERFPLDGKGYARAIRQTFAHLGGEIDR